jgi:hypothetical protein
MEGSLYLKVLRREVQAPTEPTQVIGFCPKGQYQWQRKTDTLSLDRSGLLGGWRCRRVLCGRSGPDSVCRAQTNDAPTPVLAGKTVIAFVWKKINY